MNPQSPFPKATPEGHNPLSVMQPGETMVCDIRRHPIGMLGVYLVSGFLLIALAIICFILVPHFATSATTSSNVVPLSALAFFVLAALMAGFVVISHTVYWGNRWIVTSDSLTQVTQSSLFNRQSSQLSLGNVEDVTAEQNGPIAHMFNFGVIRVETAGEVGKFVFLFCPDPNGCAKQLLDAREKFEQGLRAQEQQPAQPATIAGATQYSSPEPPRDPGVNVNTQL